MSQSKNITWDGSSSSYYELQYKVYSSATWLTPSSSPILGTSYTLSNLLDNTAYLVRVRGLCSGVITSWVYEEFTTGGSTCAAATNISVGNITSTTAKISWNSATGGNSYIVKYKKASDTTWTNSPSTTNTNLQLTFLTADTAYNVKVVTVCSGGLLASSNPYNFSTI